MKEFLKEVCVGCVEGATKNINVSISLKGWECVAAISVICATGAYIVWLKTSTESKKEKVVAA